MMLTREDLKYLEPYDNDSYTYKGDSANKKDRDRLKELDDSYLFLYGVHLIRNYKEL